MRILYPIGSLYPSQQGGPSNTVYWLAKALTRKGHEVICVTTNTSLPPEIPLNTWLKRDFGKVIYCKTRFNSAPIRMVWYSLKQLRNQDIVHLNSLFYPPSIFLYFIALFYGKTILWSVRGVLDPKALEISKVKKNVVLWLLNSFKTRKLSFHTTSPEETTFVNLHFGDQAKVVEIPNYIELPVKLEHREEKPYILYLGRLHPIKALDQLLLAIASSNIFQASGFTLRITGEDKHDYGDQLKNMVEQLNLTNLVSFEGEITEDEKEGLLANAYFLILPSHSENFGNVILEALAQGTPAIASTGTPWQILEPTKAGFWVRNSVESIRNCLELIISMPAQKYLTYRKNAYRLVTEKFNIESKIQDWEDAYQRMLQ